MQENIHPAVVVIVDEGAAAPGYFEDVGSGVDGAVDDGPGEAGSGSYIEEF